MADGAAMKRLEQDSQRALDVSDAIARLEAGDWSEDDCVDIGGGFVLRADGPLGEAGLLQRLRGHARLLALRAGEIDPTPSLRSRKPALRADVKAMLDAVRRAR